MRRVYQPPRMSGGGQIWVLLGAMLLTVGVFFLVPLTQMISAGQNKKLMLTSADVSALPPPPPPVAPPPPPPKEEEKKEEPKPQLSDQPRQLNLSQLDLDVSVGMGGAFGGNLFGSLPGAEDAVKDLAVFDVSDLDKQPVLVASVSPVYPNDLRKARVEGSVVILFVLDESGRVEDPRIETSSRVEFERPAVDALRKWKFKPGVKEGQPVRTYMRLPMKFKMPS